MSLKNYIFENIKDFNSVIKTEEDMKMKVLMPYLKKLGYDDSDFKFEQAIDVVIGTKKTKVYTDIIIIINGNVEIVIDAKSPKQPLSEKQILQSASYAKLISTPPALYGITTNGINCIGTNVITGFQINEIPSKQKLLRDLDKAKKKEINNVVLREVKSILYTIVEQEELYKVIKDSKDIIEKLGLIRSDQSFKEMTKVLLVKMNEERRVKELNDQNRFDSEIIKATALANDSMEIDVFNKLFEDAKNKYPEIYTKTDEKIQIENNDCIIKLIEKLEPFSFLGTGDDIKGAVYEIFLKTTLRGEFDQYFTPREIVDFMVKSADPEIEDKILDPSCGSGGFLIQAFNYVNKKITQNNYPPKIIEEKFSNLINKCLWGHEADYDLHVLAKINLIMHGDGWNNIFQGDTLSSNKLKDNSFDLILMNPPFTIKYDVENILSKFELGLGKDSEEYDILFVEKAIKLLKPGRDLYVILPEGLLNLPRYKFFREWIFTNTYIIQSISLPEGAFIPSGGSVSKTCILGLRKKNNEELNKPEHVFVARAKYIGYECGKKFYKPIEKNDLAEFECFMQTIFIDEIRFTSNESECGWIKQNEIDIERIDANYLLNRIDQKELLKKYPNLVQLSDVCEIENLNVKIKNDQNYNYLEIPDISENTGLITNIRNLKGNTINSDTLYKFYSNDLLFSRINPRKSRVIIVPDIKNFEFGVVSKEVYRLKYKKNEYIDKNDFYVLYNILKSKQVQNQIIRLSTGSSSSRARVQEYELLNNVLIPIPDKDIQRNLSNSIKKAIDKIWDDSQDFLSVFINNQKTLGSEDDKNNLRSI